MIDIIVIETASLGDRSYVITDGELAVVIDPQRDIDRVTAVLDERGLTLAEVFETHIHNDYVTGGLALAEATGAPYHVNADDDVEFERTAIRDGDEVAVGAFTVRAMHTPGHTPTHLSYVVGDGTRDHAVFTGGSMLFGSVGRTDLIGADMTEELTRSQFRSAHRLTDELEGDVEVHPTHGFGSFCSSAATSGSNESTIAQERRDNVAFDVDDEDEFVQRLIAGLDDYPAYYAHMGPANRSGPDAPDLSAPRPVDTAELLRRIHAGEWVVDLRTRTAFAADHVTGTVNIELGDTASTYLGWLMPWGTPVTLIADTAEEIAELQRQMVRIGIDGAAGARENGLEGLDDAAERSSYRVADFAEAADVGAATAGDASRNPWILDVRRTSEWVAGHIPGATHIPLHELEERMDEVPDDHEIWVHCAGGFRASIGSSLLARAGREPVLIDGAFDDEAPKHFDLISE